MNIYQWFDHAKVVFDYPLLKLVGDCCRSLSEEGGRYPDVYQALKAIGLHFGASHVFASLWQASPPHPARPQWRRDGKAGYHIAEHIDDLAAGELAEVFAADGIVLASNIDHLGPTLYDVLYPSGVQAVVLMPIWSEDEKLSGYMGAADVRRREWRPTELVALWVLCALLGQAPQADTDRLCVPDDEALMEMLRGAGWNVCLCKTQNGKAPRMNQIGKDKPHI